MRLLNHTFSQKNRALIF
jgi:ubiquitin C-terminal hydrolase